MTAINEVFYHPDAITDFKRITEKKEKVHTKRSINPYISIFYLIGNLNLKT